MPNQSLSLRSRGADGGGSDPPRITIRHDWDPARTAVVICDMWDAHHCVSATHRSAEMAPRMNAVVGALRSQGALIIHAPADCMDSYRGTSARMRAIEAACARDGAVRLERLGPRAGYATSRNFD
jgi:hypothetical protein